MTADFERAAADPCWRAAAARCETLPNPSSRFEEAPIPMMQHNTVGNRLLAVIAALLVVAALKASYPVTMPLAAAVLIVAAAWPLKPWLDQFLPSKLSYVGTVLALFLIFAAFLLAVYFSISRVAQAFAGRREQFVQMYGAYAAFASERGLPTLGEGGAGEQLLGLAQAVLTPITDTLTYLGVTAVLVIFALPEVPALRDKVRERWQGEGSRELLAAVEEAAGKVRDFLRVMTVTSLITGVASAALAAVLGLDLALAWGVLNFLLNYVPLIGNVVGIFPPALYAAVQFGGWGMPLLVFVGFAALQVAISNFVEPALQGRSLSLSPVVVVVALSFWGWVWGLAGTLLAIPLTAALVIICQHVRSTEWIAALLSTKR